MTTYFDKDDTQRAVDDYVRKVIDYKPDCVSSKECWIERIKLINNEFEYDTQYRKLVSKLQKICQLKDTTQINKLSEDHRNYTNLKTMSILTNFLSCIAIPWADITDSNFTKEKLLSYPLKICSGIYLCDIHTMLQICTENELIAKYKTYVNSVTEIIISVMQFEKYPYDGIVESNTLLFNFIVDLYDLKIMQHKYIFGENLKDKKPIDYDYICACLYNSSVLNNKTFVVYRFTNCIPKKNSVYDWHMCLFCSRKSSFYSFLTKLFITERNQELKIGSSILKLYKIE
jgi:hypothetical protein